MNTFLLIFIGLPALEIFLMIKIGEKIGALNTIALIFLTAIIGIYYARIQGIQNLRSGITNLYKNKVPIYELISGASIAFAALLLIVPGFFTDVIGFLLLIPFSKILFFHIILKKRTNYNQQNKVNNNTIDGEIVDKDKDEI